MGCDIHWHSEHREDSGNWVCDQAASFNMILTDYEGGQDYPEMDDFPGHERDYWFFGLLSNQVRTEWEYSFEAKGIPEGTCSLEVQAAIDYWDDDGHSHSRLDRQELEDKLNQLVQLRAEMLINPRDPRELRIEHVDHHIARLQQTIDDLKALWPEVPAPDQRIVFWFDN